QTYSLAIHDCLLLVLLPFWLSALIFRLSPHPLIEILFFFFNATATPEIYTLSLHDALPISRPPRPTGSPSCSRTRKPGHRTGGRSEEHTSELQSRENLVCRLLLEKKKKKREGEGKWYWYKKAKTWTEDRKKEHKSDNQSHSK